MKIGDLIFDCQLFVYMASAVASHSCTVKIRVLFMADCRQLIRIPHSCAAGQAYK